MKVTIELDDRKVKAIGMYIDRHRKALGDQPSLEQIVKDGAVLAFEKTYAKVVPKDVRDFIKLTE